jgi:hypothetical protein
MDGVASIGIVGAVARQTQLLATQLYHPGKQAEPAADPGTSALKLIQSVVIDLTGTGHDLDVRV